MLRQATLPQQARNSFRVCARRKILPGVLAFDRLASRPVDQDSASAHDEEPCLHFRRHSGFSSLARVDLDLHASRHVAVGNNQARLAGGLWNVLRRRNRLRYTGPRLRYTREGAVCTENLVRLI